jgi:hypothetical protein
MSSPAQSPAEDTYYVHPILGVTVRVEAELPREIRDNETDVRSLKDYKSIEELESMTPEETSTWRDMLYQGAQGSLNKAMDCMLKIESMIGTRSKVDFDFKSVTNRKRMLKKTTEDNNCCERLVTELLAKELTDGDMVDIARRFKTRESMNREERDILSTLVETLDAAIEVAKSQSDKLSTFIDEIQHLLGVIKGNADTALNQARVLLVYLEHEDKRRSGIQDVINLQDMISTCRTIVCDASNVLRLGYPIAFKGRVGAADPMYNGSKMKGFEKTLVKFKSDAYKVAKLIPQLEKSIWRYTKLAKSPKYQMPDAPPLTEDERRSITFLSNSYSDPTPKGKMTKVLHTTTATVDTVPNWAITTVITPDAKKPKKSSKKPITNNKQRISAICFKNRR